MAGTAELIKLQVCLHKRDDLPYDDFAKWCTEVYPPKAIPIMKKHNVLKWTETLTPPQHREPMRDALHTKMGRPKWTVPDHDIIMSYWIRSMDDMTALTTDPDWIELEKEATSLADMTVGQFVIGHEIVHIDALSSSSSGE